MDNQILDAFPLVAIGLISVFLPACADGHASIVVSQEEPVLHSEDNPPELHMLHKPRSVHWNWNGHQKGALRYLSTRREVYAVWTGPLDTVTGEQQSEFMSFPVAFFPSDVDVLGEDLVIVAGKGRGNKTIVEAWEFSWPATMPAPYTDPATGELHYDLKLPQLVKKERVYEDDVAGRRLVRFALGILDEDPAGEPHALVQFHDSGDLYTVSLVDGGTALVSKHNAGGTLSAIPALATSHKFAWKANHQDHGFIYVFGYMNNEGPQDPPTLVIRDTNRDGTLDDWVTVDPGAWDGTAWSDSTKYIW